MKAILSIIVIIIIIVFNTFTHSRIHTFHLSIGLQHLYFSKNLSLPTSLELMMIMISIVKPVPKTHTHTQSHVHLQMTRQFILFLEALIILRLFRLLYYCNFSTILRVSMNAKLKHCAAHAIVRKIQSCQKYRLLRSPNLPNSSLC